MTKEDYTNIVNFMIPRLEVVVIGCGRVAYIVKYLNINKRSTGLNSPLSIRRSLVYKLIGSKIDE